MNIGLPADGTRISQHAGHGLDGAQHVLSGPRIRIGRVELAKRGHDEHRPRPRPEILGGEVLAVVYQTEKVLREQGDKVTDEERAAVEQPLADVKSALNGTDIEAVKAASERLMTASQAFSQKLYEAAARDTAGAAGTSASGATTGTPSDDEVVDAEIVDEES